MGIFLSFAATILLLVHMHPISNFANSALTTSFQDKQFHGLRVQFITDAGAALLVLLVIATISVYKPWGKIQYGVSKEKAQPKTSVLHGVTTFRKWSFYVLVGLIGLVILLFGFLHITGVLGHH